MIVHVRLAILAIGALLAVPKIQADELSDLKYMVHALQQHTDALEQQLQQVREELRGLSGQSGQQKRPPLSAATGVVPVMKALLAHPASATPLPDRTTHGFFERKPGKSLTFFTPGSETASGELTTYGNLDLSFDGATKGIANPEAVGKLGWLPSLSTNISYVGIRGFQPLGFMPLHLVYQFETQLDIAATSGTGESNSSQSNTVKGALTSRNTYIGLASEKWGSIKFGKTDAPYKTSTMRMDSFYGMQGDYQVVMGNTGGDNRVEFGTRLDHSIWYESPVRRGVALNFLYSPGQNRANNSDNLAAGESDCTGGNVPGSGGITPVTCSDGSFSDAVSSSLSFTHGRWYLAAAYERHLKVNRSSDITGIYASGNTYSQMLANQNTADEDAGKMGVEYDFPSKTILYGIVESMHRYVPADLQFQNERQRMGTWVAVSQRLTRNTGVYFGWAHAFRAPGDPGQHNDSLNAAPGGVPESDFTSGAHSNNQANLFTTAFKYRLTPSLELYSDWATTANGPAAHFDLGAGGRAITTDCHDAFASAGGLVGSSPHCFAGGMLQGTSLGMDWKF